MCLNRQQHYLLFSTFYLVDIKLVSMLSANRYNGDRRTLQIYTLGTNKVSFQNSDWTLNRLIGIVVFD